MTQATFEETAAPAVAGEDGLTVALASAALAAGSLIDSLRAGYFATFFLALPGLRSKPGARYRRAIKFYAEARQWGNRTRFGSQCE